MSQREIRLAMIGCGGISHAHARAAQNTQGIRFVTCCNRTEEKARLWAAQYDCASFYTNYEQMLQREAVDGVVLATWPNQHREQIERCLELGVRAILCEKALTLTGKEALEIWQMAQDAQAFVMEGFMYRHHPAIGRIDRLLAMDELGPVDSVRACFSVYDPESTPADDSSRNWRQRKECGGGVPYDLLCYCVNACQHFVGGIPARVYCRGDESDVFGTINRMHGLIEYDNGCVGIVESSKKASLSQELQIACAGGTLSLPVAWTIQDDVILERKQNAPWPSPVSDQYHVLRADSYLLQLGNLAAVMRGQAGPIVPLAETVLNTYTIEALVVSAMGKHPVDIKIPECVAQAARQTMIPATRDVQRD
ncbi:MAG: Gfo/Idh/MocA family protein [Anaerolineae bacterium]